MKNRSESVSPVPETLAFLCAYLAQHCFVDDHDLPCGPDFFIGAKPNACVSWLVRFSRRRVAIWAFRSEAAMAQIHNPTRRIPEVHHQHGLV